VTQLFCRKLPMAKSVSNQPALSTPDTLYLYISSIVG
jgi:hypothetical protein